MVKLTVMREVISVHLGQTGVGTGLALWDCLEVEQGGEDRSRDTGVFFHEAEDGRQVVSRLSSSFRHTNWRY